MKVVAAKVLDQTHLELSQSISARAGELIQVSIPDDGEEDRLWRERAREHFWEAYDTGDAIYDEL